MFLLLFLGITMLLNTTAVPAQHKLNTASFQEICTEYWQFLIHEFPDLATSVGDHRQNDRWPDFSLEGIQKRNEKFNHFHQRLKQVNKSTLSDSNAVSYDLLEAEITEQISRFLYKDHYVMVVHPLLGFAQIPSVFEMMPLQTINDYKVVLARIKALVPVVDQIISLLEQGLQEHITLPQIVLAKIPSHFENYASAVVEKNPFFYAFKSMPQNIDKEDQTMLLFEAETILIDDIVPAMRKLCEYISDVYIPACRQSIAWSDLPNGTKWYQEYVRICTNTNLTPEEIHQIGLNEVHRIKQAMTAIMQELNFDGDLAAFYEYLRTQEKFFCESKESLLATIATINACIDTHFLEVFLHHPKISCKVEAVPVHDEELSVGAFYRPGSVADNRPGIFFVNAHNLKSLPTWELEALCLHEMVPGHHLQISRAQELELPDFRKYGPIGFGSTAFIEGWGLYSENLGTELGLYKNPYARFGKLTYEMMRAVRLVVDTGMHALGWSRQEALDYFRDLTGIAHDEAATEIDRYISWPGQALAYKIGELKIKELKAGAQEHLQEQFDIREFHELVISQGSVSLGVLEKMVKNWATQKQK